MNSLSIELKKSINSLCEEAYKIALNNHPKIRSIIVQYNNDKIFIGRENIGVFNPLYYNPDLIHQNDDSMETLVNQNVHILTECNEIIKNAYPNNRLKSFNIFYNGATREINVCKNRIGNQGINKCRLFDAFTI